MSVSRRTLATAIAAFLCLSASKAAAQVGVQLQWIYPVETLLLADFSSQGSVTRSPDVLAITLTQPSGRTQSVVLELTVRQTRPRNSVIVSGHTRSTGQLATLTDPVTRLTNKDFVQGRFEITDYDLTDAFEELLTQGSRLPAGSYVFTVVVKSPTGIVLGQSDITLELSNTRSIQLVAPGALVGQAPTIVNTATPRFTWSPDEASDVLGSPLYSLRIVKADGAASGEEAMDGFASWETVTSNTTAFYPASAEALPLEAGATYAWQVVREIRTSTGVDRIESPIYWFQVAANVGGRGGSGADDTFIKRLMDLATRLGFAGQLGTTDGSQPTWTVSSVTVDGRPVAIEGVEELLRAIAAGEVRVISVRIP
jgi:hypothetical protein